MSGPIKKFVFQIIRLTMLLFFGVVNPTTTSAATGECPIASAHRLATEAGCDILAKGGNAFDAAVAVTAALAVVEPYSSGIGGGGFYLLHRAQDSENIFVDARETAPSAMSADLFVDEEGKPRNNLSRKGATAAGIPGIPAALEWLAQKYGNLSLEKSLSPAISMARDGFLVNERYARFTQFRESLLRSFSDSAEIFLDDNRAIKKKFLLRQVNLAKTLEAMALNGKKAFYTGDIASEMVDAVLEKGGLWSLEDLEQYRVIEREPLIYRFRGASIITSPLPSSGGLVMAQAMQILENYKPIDIAGPEGSHLVVEAWRRGYNDRAVYMGDPEFSIIPIEKLSSKEYASQRGKTIDKGKATLSLDLPTVHSISEEQENTTHFSIIDGEGNRVAATLSINGLFGSGMVAGETGVLLNNHMDDFALTPGSPNAYGLVGNKINAIEAGKRPLSSMTPSFVEDSRGVLVLGTPGGSRIISMVMLAIIEHISHVTVNLKKMVSLPRYHHQYLPDRIEYEPEGFDLTWVDDLRSKGHQVDKGKRRWGNMQAVFFNILTGEFQVASDPRGISKILF